MTWFGFFPIRSSLLSQFQAYLLLPKQHDGMAIPPTPQALVCQRDDGSNMHGDNPMIYTQYVSIFIITER
jgi:hypothetical protein